MKNRTVRRQFTFVISFLFIVIQVQAQSKKSRLLQINYPRATRKSDFPNKDEVLLTRISTEFYCQEDWASDAFFAIYDPILSVSKNFEDIGFKTKRLGILEFDAGGNILNETVPVFVKRSEYCLYMKRLKPYLKRLMGK